MTQPNSISLTIPLEEPTLVETGRSRDFYATSVSYNAHNGHGPLVVTVVAHSGAGANHAWFLSFDVAPDWLPEPPAWWEEQLRAMSAAKAPIAKDRS